MRILLADDSVTAQNMGKKILSEAGHEVVCVSNGAAALKKISEQEPELVILDIYMPGYSGLEVCQKLKDTTSTADLPVVLTVGKLEPFRKEDAQRVRAEALIIKPFEATELAAAVARFAEIANAKPAKVKSKGKLGPQPKAKPQWDEPPEDEFVTTTQKLEEQEAEAAGTNSATAPAETPEVKIEAQSAGTGSEFEVKPQAEASQPAASSRAEAEASFGQDFERYSSASEGATRPREAAPAEFSVQAEQVEGGQPQVMAAAAGAGGEFRNLENSSEMSEASSPAPDFAVAAPFETAAEPPTFQSPATGTDGSLPSVSDLPMSGAPELSAAAEPGIAPGVDPAFDPDRTQWVTQFATHFGLKGETAEESASAASEPAGTESGSGSPDEIAAILSNLPGGGYGSAAESAATGEPQPDLRPWPVDPASEASGWKAEEVPLEDQDSSISLAEEMNKASEVESRFAVPAEALTPETASSLPSLGITPESGGTEGVQAAPAPETASPFAAEDRRGGGMEPAQAESQTEEPVRESDAGAAGADRVAGVMHSAAMAIATRATVSAVASQLHSQPQGDGLSAKSLAIEDLVEQVLERLKPKLIAEIKRELKAREEK